MLNAKVALKVVRLVQPGMVGDSQPAVIFQNLRVR
jgi:hypothetical protein